MMMAVKHVMGMGEEDEDIRQALGQADSKNLQCDETGHTEQMAISFNIQNRHVLEGMRPGSLCKCSCRTERALTTLDLRLGTRVNVFYLQSRRT